MRFIKISINKDNEQIINIDDIYQIIKGEDYDRNGLFPSFTLVLKSCGPNKITEEVYKQITEKIKDITL